MSYGKREAVKDNSTTIGKLLEKDPLSSSFNPPALRSPKDCVRYLLQVQQQAFGHTILEQFEYPILIRNFKLLLKEFSPEEIAIGIALSAQRASYPSSTKYVKECILWYRDLRSQPLNQYEKITPPNKS